MAGNLGGPFGVSFHNHTVYSSSHHSSPYSSVGASADGPISHVGYKTNRYLFKQKPKKTHVHVKRTHMTSIRASALKQINKDLSRAKSYDTLEDAIKDTWTRLDMKGSTPYSPIKEYPYSNYEDCRLSYSAWNGNKNIAFVNKRGSTETVALENTQIVAKAIINGEERLIAKNTDSDELVTITPYQIADGYDSGKFSCSVDFQALRQLRNEYQHGELADNWLVDSATPLDFSDTNFYYDAKDHWNEDENRWEIHISVPPKSYIPGREFMKDHAIDYVIPGKLFALVEYHNSPDGPVAGIGKHLTTYIDDNGNIQDLDLAMVARNSQIRDAFEDRRTRGKSLKDVICTIL